MVAQLRSAGHPRAGLDSKLRLLDWGIQGSVRLGRAGGLDSSAGGRDLAVTPTPYS